MNRIFSAGIIGLTMTLSLGCGDKDDSTESGDSDDANTSNTNTDADTDTDTDADTDADTDTDADADFDLTFNGSGYNPHETNIVEFALVDDADATTTVWASDVVAGVITETWVGAVTAGHSYTLFWYADLDGSQTCTSPPADHGWSEAIPAVTAQVDVSRDHNAVFEYAVCDHF